MFDIYMLVSSKCTLCVDSSKVWFLLGNLLIIVKIVVPLLVIIFGVVDFGKAVLASDDAGIKKSAKALTFRAIAGVVIFFLPTVIYVFLEMLAPFSEAREQNLVCEECIFKPYDSVCQEARSIRDKECAVNAEDNP